MANDEHVAKLREGVAVWNEWRKANPEVIPDLFAMDFRRGNFGDVILHDADLRDASLGTCRSQKGESLQCELAQGGPGVDQTHRC
jgi:hypothetical protein